MTEDRVRCGWVPPGDALYACYHDVEWGVPERDDRALFEKLVLDGMQAGLSWRVILGKRKSIRARFADFDPEALVRWGEAERAAVLADPGVIRSARKTEGAIKSAAAYLAMRDAGLSFSRYLWDYVDGRSIQNRWRATGEVPAETPLSQTIAKDLKRRGFTYCGPVIVYAFMQAVGMVNDHLVTCFRHDECADFATAS